jgi:hypothetical protein
MAAHSSLWSRRCGTYERGGCVKLLPVWPKLKAVAHTLAYDGAIVKHQQGKPLPPGQWASVTVPHPADHTRHLPSAPL